MEIIKENKILFGIIIVLIMNIILHIVVIYSKPTIESLRLDELETAQTNKIENERLIKKYEKILDIYYKRLWLENECIRLNSNTWNLVNCSLLFKK